MIYGLKHHGLHLPNTRISNTTVIENSNSLILRDNVFIGHHNFIEASNGVEIGEGCQVTNFISILSHSSHHSIRYYGSHYRDFKVHKGFVNGPVSIGAYTFIGPHSLIMPGTRIGKGCLIRAYSLVKGEFPDFAIIGGNPANVLGDTRDTDGPFLEEHPKLKAFYEEWAGRKE